MPTALVYARYSSTNQREESIAAQLRAIRSYAMKNDIEILQEYIDEAESGTSDDRPEFQHMIDDIRSGVYKIDYVLVHKTDRFARNRYDSAIYKRQLSLAGARVLAVDQPVDDSPEGGLLESVLEGFAEYFSRNLARETLKGLKENAYKGKTTGGRPPLGYGIDSDGHYIINEAEAIIVRRIFDEVLSGRSYVEVIEGLNADGYRTKYGNQFGKNSLHDILANEKYMGVYTYMRGSKKVHHGPARQDAITKEGAIPEIIPEWMFRQMQERMASRKFRNKKRKGTSAMEYPLTGKVRCGECGGRYVGNTIVGAKRGKHVYNYYRCDRENRTRTCKNRMVAKEWLESTVLNAVVKIVQPSLTDDLAEKIIAMLKEKDSNLKVEEKSLLREIVDIEHKVNNLVSALEDGNTDYAAIGTRMRDLRAQKEQKEVRLEALRSSRTGGNYKMLHEYIAAVRTSLDASLAPEERLNIISHMVQEVLVLPEEIKITLRFNNTESVMVKRGCGTANVAITITLPRTRKRL